ncbi:hypothetical protein [Nicoliella lavandulae]|uniref:Uncharacterized protein n=1 Tax=Nicoliella lavandulae TaxID=3082954 RepID=A0ABU8SK60_9LACO
MENKLDQINKQYLINSELYNSLKYMVIDFMADTEDVNPDCKERKSEIDELINSIDRTKCDYQLNRNHVSRTIRSKVSEKYRKEFNQYQRDNFLDYYKDLNGNMDAIEIEMAEDFKHLKMVDWENKK